MMMTMMMIYTATTVGYRVITGLGPVI